MPPRRQPRRLPVKNPEEKYYNVLYFYKGDLRTIDLVQRRTDAELFIRKTYGINKYNDSKSQSTRITSSELEIVRSLNHINIIVFEDGYYQPGKKRSGTGEGSGPDGALYTKFCRGDSLRHLRWRFRRQEAGPAPEAFVWHVLKGLTDAIVYLHFGLPSADDLLEMGPDTPYSRKWQSISHGDIDLFHILMASPANPGEYPKIVLGSFGKAKVWPVWSKTAQTVSTRYSAQRAEVKSEWAKAQRDDVDSMIREVVLFCQGDSVKRVNAAGEVKEPQLPRDFSQALASVLVRYPAPGGDGILRSYQNIFQFASTLKEALGNAMTPPPEPLPNSVSVDLAYLRFETAPGEESDWVYDTYLINDESYKRRGVTAISSVPCVRDILELERRDEEPSLSELNLPKPMLLEKMFGKAVAHARFLDVTFTRH